MPPSFTIDASVWVSAWQPSEPGSSESRLLMDTVRRMGVTLVEPVLLGVEVTSAIRRAQRASRQALTYVDAILRLPLVTWVALDEDLARRAIGLAATCALRGADAVYVATAQQFGATLVTLDKDQRARAPASVRACSPAEALRKVR